MLSIILTGLGQLVHGSDCVLRPCLCNATTTNCALVTQLDGVKFISPPVLRTFNGRTGTELYVRGCSFETNELFVNLKLQFRFYSLWDRATKVTVSNTKQYQYIYRTDGKYILRPDYTLDGIYECYAEIYDNKMNFLTSRKSTEVRVNFSDVLSSVIWLSFDNISWDDALADTNAKLYQELKKSISSDMFTKYLINLNITTDKLQLLNVFEKNTEVGAAIKLSYTGASLPDQSSFCSEMKKLQSVLPKNSFVDAYGCNFTKYVETKNTTKKREEDSLNSLSNVTICVSNTTTNCSSARDVAVQLNKLVSNDSLIQTSKDVEDVAEIVQNIVTNTVNDTEENTEVFNNILETVSHILDVNGSLIRKAEYWSQSSTKMVNSLDEISMKISETLSTSRSNYSYTTKNIAALMFKSSPEEVTLSATIIGKQNISISQSKQTNETIATAKIPIEALLKATKPLIRSYIYTNQKFFTRAKIIAESEQKNASLESMKRENDRIVFSVSIGDTPITNLNTPISLSFKKTSNRSGTCNFWNFTMKTKFRHLLGGWSDKGCKTAASVSEDHTNCECNHLTNFALILNPSQKINNPLSLQMITWIGCGISISGLLLTIIVYCALSELRKKFASKILISLCVSLTLTLLLFLIGAERTSSKLECHITAGLIYYFLLTTFFWMAAEGLNLYRHFVHSFKVAKSTNGDFVRFSIFAWGIPAIIVSISAALNIDHLGNNQLCIVHGNTFYFGVLLPTCIIMLVNFVVLILTLRQMRTPDSLNTSKTKEYRLRFLRFLLCSTLLGITWFFAMLAIGYLTEVFQYLFTILNSVQGLAIFALFVVFNKNVRRQVTLARKKGHYKSSVETEKCQMK